MAHNFHVRRTTEADWLHVRSLRLEMLADTPTAFLETLAHAEAESDEAWRMRAARGSSDEEIRVAAISAKGRWLGTMGGYVPAGHDGAMLVAVYVTPDARGARAGVTDALLGTIEEWALTRGSTLTLQVHEDNARAIEAYRRRGFERTGATRPYPLDMSTREIEMRKRLTP